MLGSLTTGLVQDTCKKWSQGWKLCGTRPFRDFTDNSPAGSTSDLRLNLSNAEVRGRLVRGDSFAGSARLATLA
jgi:hypothetical protein